MPESGAVMGYGYIGYIWSLFGCCTLLGVFAGSAAFLYAVGRRRERRGENPSVTVVRLDQGDQTKPGSEP